MHSRLAVQILRIFAPPLDKPKNLNHVMKVKNPSKSIAKSGGAIMLEMIFSLIVLIYLWAGLIDIGYIMWQTILASDAARYGARMASAVSRDSGNYTSCSATAAFAYNSTNTYITKTLQKMPQQLWQPYSGWVEQYVDAPGTHICIFDPNLSSPGTRSASDEDRNIRMMAIQLKFEINPAKTCLLCLFNVGFFVHPTASATYVLHNSCCDDTLLTCPDATLPIGCYDTE